MNNISNVQNKYIDTKNTYYKLQDMIGGTSETKTILLVTHNARMRCFLADIMSELMDVYRKEKKPDKIKQIRLKNCAIIKLEIYKGKNNALLSLVYEGSVINRRDGSYFISPGTQSTNNEDVEFVNIQIDLSKLDINKEDIKDNYNIYIIRHGEAQHNIKNRSYIQYDTLLTDDGIKQAIPASNALNNEIKGTVDYLFCSMLKRTRQTLGVIMEHMGLDEYHNKMVVLPCTHELKYNKQGKCDGRLQFTALENRKNCNSTNPNPKEKLNEYCYAVIGTEIDWTVYNEFVKNKKRCRDTNMIKIIINYVSKNKPSHSKFETLLYAS